MQKKVKCIMLIDDNPDDNFFHERVIRKSDSAEFIVVKQSGPDALHHLRSVPKHNDLHPDIIFLDINMPGMNGWEFMDEYKNLAENLKAVAVVVMLSTSGNPEDKLRAETNPNIVLFESKPLTAEVLRKVIDLYCSQTE